MASFLFVEVVINFFAINFVTIIFSTISDACKTSFIHCIRIIVFHDLVILLFFLCGISQSPIVGGKLLHRIVCLLENLKGTLFRLQRFVPFSATFWSDQHSFWTVKRETILFILWSHLWFSKREWVPALTTFSRRLRLRSYRNNYLSKRLMTDNLRTKWLLYHLRRCRHGI